MLTLTMHKRFVKLPLSVGLGVGILFLALLLIRQGNVTRVLAATNVLSPINAPTTWTVAGSPYIISGTVLVQAKLTIQPGVEVQFQQDSQLQIGNGGELIAVGTASTPITFTSHLTQARGFWDGIRFVGTSLNGTIQYATIEYAKVGLELRTGAIYTVTNNTFRFIGDRFDPSNSGAIINSPDNSIINYNTVYSSVVGFQLNEVSGNIIQGNIIYDIDENCLILVPQGPSSENNLISGNEIYNCGDRGISVDAIGAGNQNIITNNVISNTNGGAIYLRNQTMFTLTDNVTYDIPATNGSGVVIDGFHTEEEFHSNAICVAGQYEIDDRIVDTLLIAEGNWLGTNTPILGNQVSGNVDFDPWIVLSATSDPSVLSADGVSTSVITITMTDGAGHTVPPFARTINLSTSLGTLADSAVILDANGVATTTLTAPNTLGTAIITATEFCNFPVTTTIEFQAANLTISKSSAITEVTPGGLITYTITYTNNGNLSAENVVITDVLPTGTTWYSDTAVAQGYTRTPVAPTNLVAWELGSIPPNTNGTITLTIRVQDQPVVGCVSGGQSLTNEATISSTTFDIDSSNNNFTHTNGVSVVCADVMITKIGPGGTVAPGQTVTYTIVYTNIGDTSAENVVITDVNPVTSDIITLPNVISPLAPGASGSLPYTVTTDASICTTPGGFLTNTAYIATSTPEITTINNMDTSDTSTSPLIQCTNLAITKTVASVGASIGKVTTFTIEYANTGSFTASNVVITDFLDANIKYISDTLGIPSVVVSNTIGWSLGDLGPGENSSFEIGLQPMTCLGNSTSFTNAVRIAASTPDFDDNDNYDQAGPVTIPCGSDLVVVKNDGVGPGDPRLSVKAGDFITYTISINNVGSEIATNVVLTETLPANTVFVGPVDTDGWFLVGGSTYTYAIGNLNPNEGRVVKFIVQVAPDLPCSVTEVVNTVQAGSDNVDLDSTDNISNEDTPVECQPLLLSKHDGGLICAIPGQLIDYTITVTNNNIVPVNDLVLTEFPDPNTSFQGPLDQWPVAPPYVHSIETLDPGEPKPIPFWVQVDPAIPASVNAITNVVTLTPTNLVFTLTTPIVRDAPDLYVVKNDNIELIPRQTAETIARIEQKVGRALPWLETFKMQARSPKALSVSPGDVISYSVAYGNAGTFTATNVVITETLPDNTQFLGPAYWTQINANTYIFTITNLIPNQGGILDFRVRVDDPFPDNTIGVTNTVRISSDYLLECDPSDNISVEFTPVQSLTGTFIYLPLILRNYPVLTETPTPAPNPPSPTATPLPLAWVSDVVADPTTNQVFIASPREDAVHVIDGASDTYNRAVPVGHGPSGLAVLTSTTPSKILVVHEPDWTPGLWFINTNSLTSHSMVDQDGYVGARPVKVTANSLTNRAYVSNYWDRMPLINTLSESRIAWVHKKNFQASQGIKVSQPTNLVYMTSIDTGELIIFDAVQSEGDPDNYGACHNAPPDDDNNGDADPRNLRMVAVNPTTGHVFVTSPPDQNTGQTDSRVYVLDEATLLAEAQANGGPPSDLTCTWNFLPNGQRSPTALPGRGWIATIPLSGASPAGAGHVGIAVNPLTGKVYITDGEANKLFIIQDGKTASLSLPIQIIDTGFDNPQGVDVNFVTNKVYVANARDVNAPYGSVTVVDGASNTVLDIIPLDGSP